MRVTYYNRNKRPGNYSIEELFFNISFQLQSKIRFTNYFFDPVRGILKSILDVRKYEGDVNHITGDVNFLALGLSSKKTIITVHDIGHFETTLKGWKKWIYKYFWFVLPLRKVKYITTISEFTKEKLQTLLNIPSEKIIVIPNPCPPNFIAAPISFNKERPKILQIGSGRNKNISRLIEAVKGIKCEIILIRNKDNVLEKNLIDNNISYKWYSHLSYHQVYEKYVECDIVFFASEYEGFGMPIIEAQMTGRPIITSRVAAMPEIAGVAACLVDPYNVQEIKDALLRIIEDQAYRNDLIQKGFENTKRFTPEYVAEKYFQLYQKICQN